MQIGDFDQNVVASRASAGGMVNGLFAQKRLALLIFVVRVAYTKIIPAILTLEVSFS